MKKTMCLLPALLLFAMTGAPNARADSYTATFTCDYPQLTFCPGGVPPAAPDVSFPAPTAIDVTQPTFALGVFDVTLPAPDAPTDAYIWELSSSGTDTYNQAEVAEWTNYVNIYDNTTAISSRVDMMGGPETRYTDNVYLGTLTFAPVTAASPEPSSIILMLLGAGLIFLIRKRPMPRLPRSA